MISHSVITAVWMIFAGLLYIFLNLSPWYFALTSIAWWWSREQYWEERKLHDEKRYSLTAVVKTIFMVWLPKERNLDLIAPTGVAIILATIITLL